MSSHSNSVYSNADNLLLFEIIERIARFSIHLEEIEARFYASDALTDRSNDILSSYRDCLKKFLRTIRTIYQLMTTGKCEHSKLMPVLSQILASLGELHAELVHLPRPPEPPELNRFGRILDKHIMKLKRDMSDEGLKETKISIYLDETISEEAFAGDPLSEFKEKKINNILDSLSNILSADSALKVPEKFLPASETSPTYHMTIPRIDSNNPCRWPALVHELAHKIMKNDFFKMGNILADFEQMLIADNLSIQQSLIGIIDLKSWLTECWCDLIGAIVMGPVFWFAQYSTFLFGRDLTLISNVEKTHPPAIFRLNLIWKVIVKRFPNALFKELKDTMTSFRCLLYYFDNLKSEGFQKNHDLRELFLYFQDYFFRHLFIYQDDGLILGEMSLNKQFKSLIKYTERIEGQAINEMILALNEKLPIPSAIEKTPEGIEELAERPALVQEILLAAWIYRNIFFKKSILEEYKKINSDVDSVESDLLDKFEKNIVKLFSEFNFSILRSIQVGEWFHLLMGKRKSANNVDANHKKVVASDFNHAVLADHEIREMLLSNTIKVIPLINLSEQLGSTSLDIRLGTSFQIYYPNNVGLVDFTDKLSIISTNINSALVDLDYLKSITLSPGQFILGHSMEYIKLPENISAEVEGRSSFARLGIQVHMTAGFIDPGFQGVLTFEIFNAGPNPVRLFPGIRIGQLRFFSGSKPNKPYDRNPSAKYKGLLAHHKSLQFRDYEIELISNELNELKNRRELNK